MSRDRVRESIVKELLTESFSQLVNRPAELSVRRLSNGSTEYYLGGTLLSIDEVYHNGRRAIQIILSDDWTGKKIRGV